ncbi:MULTISPECIES: archaeosortase/exosortase family protein [Thalassotalea]|uniref:Archaeosortase/exosortase family protein n=1 Tax=Thalassotalea castellviae TaxID=3075612 RepID=A0ABU3A4Z8_9GAMM|nr:archaeosortase/exosortase family protein [Thalassotalea sp. W431]MDT0604895.1 archaeosortase/exosortase family protein [Thalassotalea sp. W431]
MSKLSKVNQQDEQSLALKYFPRFLLYLIILQSIVYWVHRDLWLSQTIQHALSNSVAYLYQLIAEPIIVDGNLLKHTNSTRFLIVDNECTGLMLIASVSAVVLALNQPIYNKICMLIVAVLVLHVENILRIIHLMYEIKEENNDFDFYHLYIWQIINFVTALLVIVGVERILGSKAP